MVEWPVSKPCVILIHVHMQLIIWHLCLCPNRSKDIRLYLRLLFCTVLDDHF